ncbi:ATP dependent DNA ligase [Pelomyxa schiedti]|nr:ATP dependent DNA ligase [Pelomyxa schiedti]
MAATSVDSDTINIKFPRTKHLLNVGGASRDDLIMDAKDVRDFLSRDIIVEEKIDGSNLGISITHDNQIRFQNRSHWVTSATATQWKGLEQWVSKTPALYDILTPDTILFGEWMAIKHSIHYTRLPSPFVAFDIYDIPSKKFLSTTARNAKLEGTGIPTVPLVASGRFSREQLLAMLQGRRSDFYDGPAEGLYLRIENATHLEQRAKIVRADFLPDPNVTHWTKNVPIKNIVMY